jgi:hypothetical protein
MGGNIGPNTDKANTFPILTLKPIYMEYWGNDLPAQYLRRPIPFREIFGPASG